MTAASSFPPLPRVAWPGPCRLGVPSYVYPADILPNVEALAPFVDDIELVLFESDEPDGGRTTDGGGQTTDDGRQRTENRDRRSYFRGQKTEIIFQKTEAGGQKPEDRGQRSEVSDRKLDDNDASGIPSRKTVARLAELAQQHDLTYTVHFPIDRNLGSPYADERVKLQRQMLAIMDRVAPLNPFAYVAHLTGVVRDSSPARVRTWQQDIGELLPALIERVGDPMRLCVENLNYPFGWCDPLLDNFGLGVCIDLGHLWVGGFDADAHLKRYLSRARVIHLHGARDNLDHLPLTSLPPNRLQHALNSIGKFNGVLTLEIFDYKGIRDSLGLLAPS